MRGKTLITVAIGEDCWWHSDVCLKSNEMNAVCHKNKNQIKEKNLFGLNSSFA